jgi:hypothetical protein
LFSVAAGLIIGETWRSSRSQSKQRSDVNDSIEELQIRVRELNERLRTWEAAASEEQQRCVTITYIHVLANSKADTRNSLASWTVSLRSGFEVAPGQNCRMIPLSNPLAFNPTNPCHFQLLTYMPSVRIPNDQPIPYQAPTIPEIPL